MILNAILFIHVRKKYRRFIELFTELNRSKTKKKQNKKTMIHLVPALQKMFDSAVALFGIIL